tara:strand:+ start:133 stop:330 length:198 start_codon:yes stop_codon:yes gene_type:complete
VIAANHDGQGTGIKYGTHASFDIGMALFSIRMDDVSVADVDYIYVTWQIYHVVLMVIRTCVTETE